MQLHNLSDMVKGWICGDFEPCVMPTKDFEVAVKYYQQGDAEERHVHKVATEITVIAEGRVRMNGKEYKKGDIIVMEPGEATDFEALTDAINVVVKSPSVKGDKYIVGETDD